ncbi:hypothetical protein ACFSSC_09440 [Corynebacterium mendelii]|uniref:Uncharacterized protein n=2 Tax=Corynebacterium mendelii TaxID=2765362 RepID=A0A939IWE3_9CORY|nr:hypothetical protein [Corynebacterium mendelii]MBN9645201.1 hypothetical protein [Corynebacterium mendelii]
MKRTLTTLAASVALAVSCAVPAQAAGIAATQSWTHGADGVTSFVNSQDCTFMTKHSTLMGFVPGVSYEKAKIVLTGSTFVRGYMSDRIDQGAGDWAKAIPDDVRARLIDLSIAGTLKKAAECDLVIDPDHQADKDYNRQIADGNAAYGEVTVTGVLSETPGLLSSLMGSSGSSES